MDIFEHISTMPADEIYGILEAVLKRFEELHPTHKLQIISLPINGNRNEQIDQLIRFLENQKTS